MRAAVSISRQHEHSVGLTGRLRTAFATNNPTRRERNAPRKISGLHSITKTLDHGNISSDKTADEERITGQKTTDAEIVPFKEERSLDRIPPRY